MSLTRHTQLNDSEFQEIPLEEILPAESDKTSSNESDTRLLVDNDSVKEQIIVIHDRNLLIIIFKDCFQVIVTRFGSVGSYALAWQLFIRQSKDNLLLGADFVNIGSVSLTMRELLRFITNDTKVAVENGQIDQLQKMFLTTHVAAIPLTALVWTITQSYALMLPLIGRDAIISQQLQLFPTKFLGNFFSGLILSLESYYGYGRGHLTPILIAYSAGSLVIGPSYLVIRQFNSRIEGFLLANLLQNMAIAGTYLAYIQRYHSHERLIPSLFNFRAWPEAFKHGFHLMKSGVQPAAIYAIEVISNALVTVVMRSKTELAAFQGLQIFPTVFSAVALTFETRMAAQVIELKKKYENNPDALAKELKRLMLHATWISNLFPLAFFLVAILLRPQIVPLLIKANEENTDVIRSAEKDLLIVAIIPLVKTSRSVFYGIISGFKHIKDSFHQKQNRNATVINSVSAVTMLLIGAGLDYGFELGAYGYWLGMLTSLGASSMGLAYLALQSIKHEANPAYSTSQPKQSSFSTSWCGFRFASSNHTAVPQEESPAPGFMQRASDMVARIWRR